MSNLLLVGYTYAENTNNKYAHKIAIFYPQAKEPYNSIYQNIIAGSIEAANKSNKTITIETFIIEKKFQQCSGSVCEKIQTPDFKLWQYSRTFPDYTIIYIYCLSDWFKKNCKAELEYLDFKNIPYFWGISETYKDDIINFILNYK